MHDMILQVLFVRIHPTFCGNFFFLSFFLLLFLHFTDTVEEFEDSIMQKKMKIPKMSITNSGNSIENNCEERMPLRHKKVGTLRLDRTVTSIMTLNHTAP